ncbi:MAG: ligase-associated DNA damage response endonuclease PdeM, partial [Caulobacterales bacterium]
MFMLSGPQRKAPSRRRADAPMPLVAVEGACASLKLAGVHVTALPCGGLWLAESRTLIVSDLHLEKASSFARRGQMLPPYDTRATLSRLEAAMKTQGAARVVSLGDSFHDVGGPDRMDDADRERLKSLVTAVEWVWIEGNHDPEIPDALGGVVTDEIVIDALTLRHAPKRNAAPGEIAGHLHPCAKVFGRGRSVRARCFATDGARLVMPAYGAFTGG